MAAAASDDVAGLRVPRGRGGRFARGDAAPVRVVNAAGERVVAMRTEAAVAPGLGPARRAAVAAPAVTAPAEPVVLRGLRRMILMVAVALATILGLAVVPGAWIYVMLQAELGPASMLLLLAGLIAVFAVSVRALSALSRYYCERTGIKIPYLAPAWRRSWRGDRSSLRPVTVIENTATIITMLAVIAFVVWFFGFAGDPTGGV